MLSAAAAARALVQGARQSVHSEMNVSDLLRLPAKAVASRSVCAAACLSLLVSYSTLAWNFHCSKPAVDASKYREPSPERLIKDDEQA